MKLFCARFKGRYHGVNTSFFTFDEQGFAHVEPWQINDAWVLVQSVPSAVLVDDTVHVPLIPAIEPVVVDHLPIPVIATEAQQELIQTLPFVTVETLPIPAQDPIIFEPTPDPVQVSLIEEKSDEITEDMLVVEESTDHTPVIENFVTVVQEDVIASKVRPVSKKHAGKKNFSA